MSGELQRKVLDLEHRLAKQKKRLCSESNLNVFSLCFIVIIIITEMQKEQQKHEDEDYVEGPKRKKGRHASS